MRTIYIVSIVFNIRELVQEVFHQLKPPSLVRGIQHDLSRSGSQASWLSGHVFVIQDKGPRYWQPKVCQLERKSIDFFIALSVQKL